MHSAIQKCYVKDEVAMDKSDTDGQTMLVATDCEDGITMCMNMTVLDSDNKPKGTKFFMNSNIFFQFPFI